MSKCHDKVDSGDINIDGWELTSNGKVLNYNLTKKKKKKLTKKQKEIIKSYNGISLKKAKKIILEKHQIKLSKSKITEIWNNS